jgi:hypothetical protein
MHYEYIGPKPPKIVRKQRRDRSALETPPFAYFGDPCAVAFHDPGAHGTAARQGFYLRPLPLIPAAQGDVPLHPASYGGIEVLVYVQDLHEPTILSKVER